MTGDALGFALCLAGAGLLLTWLTGRGGYLARPGAPALTWTPQALALGGLTIVAAAFFYGLDTGIAIVGAVMWHEWGHVIAYRVAGHDDARFRLIPLFGGVAISNQTPRNHAADCFVALMGPGFSVSLVVILLFGAFMLDAADSPLAFELHWAAIVTAALNAFNMLPLWPLDGGRVLRSISVTVAPGLAGVLTTMMSAVLVAFAVMKQMWLLLLFGLLGFGYAQQAQAEGARLAPMTRGQAALAAAGYLAVLGAHVLAGLPLLLRIVYL